MTFTHCCGQSLSVPSFLLHTVQLAAFVEDAESQAAGTSAHVVLELFGGDGATSGAGSGMHCLEQGPYQPIPFGPGQTDAFEVSNPLKSILSNHTPACFSVACVLAKASIVAT